ncbi:hypothetical protein A2U01_0116144, partial [Trifolium medium]|nr:hypothetical protein [Trifolium medium]
DNSTADSGLDKKVLAEVSQCVQN